MTNRKILNYLITIMIVAISSILLTREGTNVHAAKIKMNHKTAVLTKGETLQLKVTGTKSAVKWKTSNRSIVTVSPKGKIKAMNPGYAKVTANVRGKKYACEVSVAGKKGNQTTLILDTFYLNKKFQNYLKSIKVPVKYSGEDKTQMTITMTKSQQSKIFNYIKENYTEYVSQKVPSSYIESITGNQDLTKIDLVVDKEQFLADQNSYNIYLDVFYLCVPYQLFQGVDIDDAFVEISFIDKDTNLVLDYISFSMY